MKRLQGLDAAAAAGLRRPAVTLGTFDGVHVGHRYVLEQTVRLARERGGEAVVVTFAEHPRAVIDGRAPQMITSLPHRLRLFERLGVDAVVVLDFDDALRRVPAEEFARRVFHDVLRAEVVLLGWNARFGEGGRGDFALLARVGRDFGFEARRADRLTLGDEPVSSTEIRRAILSGDLDRAARMLGRPVSVLGTVVAGDGRGRTLGWPTANLDLHHELRPPRGVYGAEVEWDGRRVPALVNIGVRPTFDRSKIGVDDPTDWEIRDLFETVEVHLLDYRGDLYGKDLEVFFLKRLRDERRFAGKDELLAQLAQDRRDFETFLKP
ncbi:MAG TPA: riboflavin biosynthesis protein RibF [Planctomycetota bacterium]|nr:riboflavin biosynthesis protein RibF [Planctomycetota bacterium]